MKKLLIANRGEIALRIIRTAHTMGISTVAVYSDADAQALHVRQASTAYALGGSSAAQSYLRADKLLAAARATGADAVHPGYGFLSENADFAQAVVDAGLIWVGPPPAAIRALGSKSAAKALALAHGVPCLPGYNGADQSDTRFEQEAQRIGLPLMVKAVAGGGGRGMRRVTDMAQLRPALASARSEALTGFGSDALLIERALLSPRHVEVQVFADTQGHCIHLGERDCSVQRRYQKLIEETPSPAVGAALRERMGRCAVELAQAAGYVGAGTVEFLLEGGEFYFMEMNTRLQVEHPVTELVTGLDLVQWQISVARGEPLPLAQTDVRLSGHAIEVRLCAEDEDFTPHSGQVRVFEPPPALLAEDAGEGRAGGQPRHFGKRAALRFDHAIHTGMVVTPYYDSMLGKLIAHAPTRTQAVQHLAQALDALVLLGLPNNRAMLAACLRHAQFAAGQASVPFLAEYGQQLRQSLAPGQAQVLAAALAVNYAQPPVQSSASPASWALPCPFVRSTRWQVGPQTWTIAVQEQGAGALLVSAGGQAWVPAQLHAPMPGKAQRPISIESLSYRTAGTVLAPGRWQVQVDGSTFILNELSYAPPEGEQANATTAQLCAPFNGKLIAVHVAAGASVSAGQALLVIESMKLEHTLSAPRNACIATVLVQAGQQVAPGQVLLTFDKDAA